MGIGSPQPLQAVLRLLVMVNLLGVEIRGAVNTSANVLVTSSTLAPSGSSARFYTTIPASSHHSQYENTSSVSEASGAAPAFSKTIQTKNIFCYTRMCQLKHASVQNNCQNLLLNLNISKDQMSQKETFLYTRKFLMGNFSLSVGSVSSIISEDPCCNCEIETDMYLHDDACALSMSIIESSKRRTGFDTEQIINSSLSLSRFTNVKALSLRNNNIANLSKKVFQQLINLQALDLSNNSLIYLNLTEAPFHSLKKLRLSENKLQWIDSLAFKLTSLYVDSNNISDLSFILQFEHLRILDASDNNIRNISSNISKLKNLTCIFLDNNKIKHVAFLQNISKVNTQRISLSRNEIQSVNVNLTENEALLSLEMSDNNISCFNFMGVKHLAHLDLCNNHISEITPTHPLRESDITSFRLCNNSLTNAAVIMLMKNLVKLDLSHNSLQDVDKMFQGKKYLQKLTLSNVTLQSLDFVKNLPRLKELRVDDNNITQLPERLFETINTITLSNNPLERIYCPSNLQSVEKNENVKNIIANCNMSFDEGNDKIIFDVRMKGKEINKNVDCILRNPTGKEFLNQCSTYSNTQRISLEQYILVMVIFILNIL